MKQERAGRPSLPIYGGLDAGPRPGAREQVRDALDAGASPIAVAERVEAALDDVMARWMALDVPGEAKPACARGCAHCCHVRVELTAPEAFLLARYLRAHPDAERDARVAATAAALQGMDGRAHHLAQVRCALLGEDGTCTAYPARPLACRRAHSTDASVCAAVHAQPALDVRIPSAPSLQWNASSLVLGWLEGCVLVGRAPHHHELHGALRIALADPAAEARFLAGEDPLAPARTVAAEELPRLLGAADAEGSPPRDRT
jgi:Fe-S-cluster containining protein